MNGIHVFAGNEFGQSNQCGACGEENQLPSFCSSVPRIVIMRPGELSPYAREERRSFRLLCQDRTSTSPLKQSRGWEQNPEPGEDARNARLNTPSVPVRHRQYSRVVSLRSTARYIVICRLDATPPENEPQILQRVQMEVCPSRQAPLDTSARGLL